MLCNSSLLNASTLRVGDHPPLVPDVAIALARFRVQPSDLPVIDTWLLVIKLGFIKLPRITLILQTPMQHNVPPHKYVYFYT